MNNRSISSSSKKYLSEKLFDSFQWLNDELKHSNIASNLNLSSIEILSPDEERTTEEVETINNLYAEVDLFIKKLEESRNRLKKEEGKMTRKISEPINIINSFQYSSEVAQTYQNNQEALEALNKIRKVIVEVPKELKELQEKENKERINQKKEGLALLEKIKNEYMKLNRVSFNPETNLFSPMPKQPLINQSKPSLCLVN